MERIYVESKVKKIDATIEKAIKKIGIVYPHPSIAFFRSVFAELEKPNKNRVILAQEVENDIPQLIGCQVNLSHRRYGYIVGQIIHAFKNSENQIEIVFTFHKSIYDKEYEDAIKSFNKGELTVSFELMFDQSDLEVVKGGYRRLKKVSFDGVGLLRSGETPACPVAVVFERARQMMEDVKNQEERNLIYANANDIAKKWANLGEVIEKIVLIQDKQGGNLEMDKKTNDILLAKFKEEVTKELGEEIVKEWDEARWEEELKKRAEASETTSEEKKEEVKSEETKAEETKVEETQEENKVAAEVKAETEEKKEEAKSEETKEEKPSEEIAKKYSCECLECGKKVQTTEHCKDIKCPECGGEMRREDRPSKTAQEENSSEKVKSEEAQEVHEKTIETRVYDVIRDDSTNKMEVVETTTVSVEKDGKVVKDEKIVRETVYSQEQIDAMKADYETKLVAKEEEIKFVKEHASEIIRIRAEFGDFVKDMSDEDLFNEAKMEIIKLKKENAELKAKVVVTASEETPEAKKDENIQATETTTEEETTEESSAERVKELVKQRYNK